MFKEIDYSIYKYLIVSALILLPIIAFPISSDLSVFMHGGMVVANGGELFKDFFDIKPPLIYQLFGVISYFFGDTVIAFRIFDFFYQLLFLLSAAIIFTKLNFEKKVIKSYLILFPLSYTILNYRDVLQTESLAFLPIILYFYLLLKSDFNYKNTILMGVLLGVAIAFKYTLGIVFICSIIQLVSKRGISIRTFSLLALQLLVALLILFGTFLPIILQGNWEGFVATQNYLVEYAKYPPMGIEFLKTILKNLYYDFGSIISVSFLFFALLSLFRITKNKITVVDKYVLLFSLLLFISFIIERKINLYHVSRIYPFLLILVSYGFVYFTEYFKFKWNVQSLVFVCIFLFMSPMLRFVNTYKIAYNRLFNYEKYVDYYTEEGTFNILNNHLDIADYVNNQSEEKFLFLNTGGNQAIHYIDSEYKYKFPHSAFHLSPKAPLLYKKAFEEDLYDANILALDNKDDIFLIFLTEGSSYDLIFENKSYKSYIEKNFTFDTLLLDRYYIYKRNK